jgi:hypothetical protein
LLSKYPTWRNCLGFIFVCFSQTNVPWSYFKVSSMTPKMAFNKQKQCQLCCERILTFFLSANSCLAIKARLCLVGWQFQDSSFDLNVKSSFKIRACGETTAMCSRVKTLSSFESSLSPLDFSAWALGYFRLCYLSHVITTLAWDHFWWGHFSCVLNTSVLVHFWWGHLSYIITIFPRGISHEVMSFGWGHPIVHIFDLMYSRMLDMLFKLYIST